jgi:hypothetical protein
VTPVVPVVDEGVYGLRGGSARWFSRSKAPGVASCGGCGRTEGLQAPAAQTRSLSPVSFKKTVSESERLRTRGGK